MHSQWASNSTCHRNDTTAKLGTTSYHQLLNRTRHSRIGQAKKKTKFYEHEGGGGGGQERSKKTCYQMFVHGKYYEDLQSAFTW